MEGFRPLHFFNIHRVKDLIVLYPHDLFFKLYPMKFLELRQTGYDLLKGSGLEIGAFEHPACLPTACSVEYVDRFSTFEAQSSFLK